MESTPIPYWGPLRDLFQNFLDTPILQEIVAGLHCQPLGTQIPLHRVMRDGALRMAAYLPDHCPPAAGVGAAVGALCR